MQMAPLLAELLTHHSAMLDELDMSWMALRLTGRPATPRRKHARHGLRRAHSVSGPVGGDCRRCHPRPTVRPPARSVTLTRSSGPCWRCYVPPATAPTRRSSLEKLEDVAWEQYGSPVQLLQLKPPSGQCQ